MRTLLFALCLISSGFTMAQNANLDRAADKVKNGVNNTVQQGTQAAQAPARAAKKAVIKRAAPAHKAAKMARPARKRAATSR